jgi:hypothetical protein
MKTYIILMDIAFDWSNGEYGLKYVNDIYLGHGDFSSKEKAEEKGKTLYLDYLESEDSVVDDEFTGITIKEL